MKKSKEIIVFTVGDSTKLSTWSNVPYFFTTALEKKNNKVNRINLQETYFLKLLYFLFFGVFIKLFFPKSNYTYYRSLLNYIDTNRKIKKAYKSFPNSDLAIFLTFSFSSKKYSKKPLLLFGDWTYDHYFNYFSDHKPYRFEKESIKRENSCIESADMIVALFPKIANYMKQTYANKNIYYLGNVINSNSNADSSGISARSNTIVFVGTIKYIEGLTELIAAIAALIKSGIPIKLDVIGITESEYASKCDFAQFHGYLDKGDETQCAIYYSILRNAKLFVNTNKKWASFSASLEAMHHYIPVIVSPYSEFIETFGENISFGIYCNDSKKLSESIVELISHPNYFSFCINAHEAVKNYTWDSYIDKILK